MSIDEYLQKEMERGNFLQGTNPVVDNEESSEEDIIKARKWDEFKDHNPRGSGNRMNRG
jgi:immunoglobulin-binding protein 1